MKKIMLIIFILSTLCSTGFMRDLTVCPTSEELSPYCVCEKACSTCMKMITCNNILNIQQIFDLYNTTGDFPLDNLKITNSTFVYMPASQLDFKQIRLLAISNSNLAALFDTAPPEQNIIEHISLSGLMIQRSIDWTLFSSLRLLKGLDFIDVRIRRITNAFGENMPENLTDIVFRRTETTRIVDNAFAPLKNLRTIRIVNNKIKTISRSMFPTPFTGTVIDFEGNLIEDIPDDFFSDMPNIKFVMFEHNHLVTLKESFFGNLPSSVTAVFVEGNSIVCDCSVSWLPRNENMTLIIGKCAINNHINSGKHLHDLEQSDFSSC